MKKKEIEKKYYKKVFSHFVINFLKKQEIFIIFINFNNTKKNHVPDFLSVLPSKGNLYQKFSYPKKI